MVASTLARAAIDFAVCQPGEALPAGVSGIRLALWAFYGANVHVRVYKGSQVLTAGSRGADWTSDSVTVPVRPLDHSSSGVTLCFGIGPNSQPISLLGVAAPPSVAAPANTASDERRPRLSRRANTPLCRAGSASNTSPPGRAPGGRAS